MSPFAISELKIHFKKFPGAARDLTVLLQEPLAGFLGRKGKGRRGVGKKGRRERSEWQPAKFGRIDTSDS